MEYRFVSSKTQVGKQLLAKSVLEATSDKNLSTADWVRAMCQYGEVTKSSRNYMIPVKK